MREEPGRKQSKKLNLKLLKMAICGNKISHQLENHWLIKRNVLESLGSIFISGGKLDLILGVDCTGPAFAFRVSLNSF